MQTGYYRRAVVMQTWSVVALLALWSSAGFAVTLQTATVLDAPHTDVPSPDGPRVNILKPAFGDVVKGKNSPIALQFAAGKQKIVLIELLVNDKVVASLDEKGIANFVNQENQAMFAWDTTRLKDGVHKLTVRVTDAAGLRNSMWVNVAIMNTTVDQVAPAIAFLQPRDNEVRGKIEVVVQAKDNFGIRFVSVYLVTPDLQRVPKGLFIGSRGNTPQLFRFFLNTHEFPNGPYLMFAEVEDYMGNIKTSAPFRLKIANAGGQTPLPDTPPAPPIIVPPPPGEGSMVQPQPPGGGKEARHSIRSVGPLTAQRSVPPADQAIDLSPLSVQAPKAQPYVTAPEPRLDPKMTMSHPDFEFLIGSGEGRTQVDATKPPLRYLASRPNLAQRSEMKLSAERGGVGSVRPNESPMRSPLRTARKNSPPPAGARHIAPAPECAPQMTLNEQGLDVGTEIGSPPIGTTPKNNPTVGMPSDASRIVSTPKRETPTRTPSAIDNAAIAVPPSQHVGALPGRKPEHRMSTPDVVANPPLPPTDTAMIKALPPTEPYTVKKGDTLASIAAAKRLTVEMIREANPHRKLTALKPGQTILLPRRLPIYVNGELLAKPDEPIGALLMDSIALAPFRHVFERSGGFVDWNGPQRLVTGVKGAQNVQLRIGDRTALVNGEPITLQAEPFILYGRTHVPIRFFEQALNLYVEWDKQNGRVVMLPK